MKFCQIHISKSQKLQVRAFSMEHPRFSSIKNELSYLYSSLQVFLQLLNVDFMVNGCYIKSAALVVWNRVVDEDTSAQFITSEDVNNLINVTSTHEESSISVEADKPSHIDSEFHNLANCLRNQLTYNRNEHKMTLHQPFETMHTTECRRRAKILNRFVARLRYFFGNTSEETKASIYLSTIHLEIFNVKQAQSSDTKRAFRNTYIEHTIPLLDDVAREEVTWHPHVHQPHQRRYKGVRYRSERTRNPWIAEIKPPSHKNKVHIGSFGTPEEAARAYDAAAIYFKKRTPLNFQKSLHSSESKLRFLSIPTTWSSPNQSLKNLDVTLEKQHGLHGFMSTLIPLKSQRNNFNIENEETQAFITTHKARCEITGVVETEDTRHAIENYLQGAEPSSASLKALNHWTDSKIDKTTSTWLWETVTPPVERDTNLGLYTPSRETFGEPLPLVGQQTQVVAMPSYTMELAEKVQQAYSVSLQDPSKNNDHWTEIIAQLMDNTTQNVRPQDLATNQGHWIPPTMDFHNMLPNSNDGLANAQTGSLGLELTSNQLMPSPTTLLQHDWPPTPRVVGGENRIDLDESNNLSTPFMNACQSLIKQGDSSKNVEELLQLVRLHYSKYNIEVTLQLKQG